MHVHVSSPSSCKPICALGPLASWSFYLQNAIIQPPLFMTNHPPSRSHFRHKFKYPSVSPHLTNIFHSVYLSLSFECPLSPHDLGMESEPDDYQTISDNCPGYMVLISEGIVCTRCRGEKRHKPNDCPKTATAADLATDHVSGADLDGDGMENADMGMESLSDTDSVSSESTAHSDGSDMRMTDAHQSDQGGNHPQDTERRDFARPAASHTSIQPDRTSPSLPNLRAVRKPNAVHQTSSEAGAAIHQTKSPSHHDRDVRHGRNTPALVETHSTPRSGTTNSTQPPSKVTNSTRNPSDKAKKGSHPHAGSIHQVIDYETSGDRLPPKSLVDTMGKFDYSNTTCPSSFGFGRLPSEAMG